LETRKFYTRYEDMSPDGTLTLYIEDDGDVIVDVQGIDPMGERTRTTVQFCTYGGGGQSLKVRQALLNLAVAILEDNAEKPQYRDGK